MFGAPFGAMTGLGKSDFESLTLNPIWPLNGPGATGSTSCAATPVNEVPQASVELMTANAPRFTKFNKRRLHGFSRLLFGRETDSSLHGSDFLFVGGAESGRLRVNDHFLDRATEAIRRDVGGADWRARIFAYVEGLVR
jgi:hypothetical protein